MIAHVKNISVREILGAATEVISPEYGNLSRKFGKI